MDTSKATPELFAALAKAQAEVENASKSSNNPHFKSKYADLAEVLNTVRPVFAAHGLAILQSTEFDGSLVSVTTAICHASGGLVTSTASCVPAKSDGQGIGSATTYLRRYSLAAMSGIAQEDDDGNAAAHNKRPATSLKVLPTDGAWDALDVAQKAAMQQIAATIAEYMEASDAKGAHEFLERQHLQADEKMGLWTLLDSKTRSALKREHESAKTKEAA